MGIPLASQLFEQLNVPVVAPVLLANGFNGITYVSGSLSDALKIRGKPELSVTIEPLQDVEPNAPLQVNLDLTATAYDVPAGHRVVLVLDTQGLLYAAPTDDKFYV